VAGVGVLMARDCCTSFQERPFVDKKHHAKVSRSSTHSDTRTLTRKVRCSLTTAKAQNHQSASLLHAKLSACAPPPQNVTCSLPQVLRVRLRAFMRLRALHEQAKVRSTGVSQRALSSLGACALGAVVGGGYA
jgi:hypothetical protein